MSTRLDAFMHKIQEKHKVHANYNHWYIFCFGISPEFQGKGIGTILLNFLNSLADKD
jgi:ribosomal protein S18 acetylase RimI-like enzyme